MYLTRKVNTADNIRLFCFPYAGVGASSFDVCHDYLSSGFSAYPIQLPGRENRIYEEPHVQMGLLVQELFDELEETLCEKPFAFFGHCLGAFIAYELSCLISQVLEIQPIHFFISGCPAPQKHHIESPLHQLSPKEFLERIQQIEGPQTAGPVGSGVANILFPCLKADFILYETYQFQPRNKLHCAMSLYGGQNDHYVEFSDMALWQELTDGPCYKEQFQGSHFYLHEQMPQVMSRIDARLAAISCN